MSKRLGFSAWRNIMPKAEAAGARGSPHAWGEPLKTIYASQIAAGLGNTDLIEGVPGTVTGVDTSRTCARQVPSRPYTATLRWHPDPEGKSCGPCASQ